MKRNRKYTKFFILLLLALITMIVIDVTLAKTSQYYFIIPGVLGIMALLEFLSAFQKAPKTEEKEQPPDEYYDKQAEAKKENERQKTREEELANLKTGALLFGMLLLMIGILALGAWGLKSCNELSKSLIRDAEVREIRKGLLVGHGYKKPRKTHFEKRLKPKKIYKVFHVKGGDTLRWDSIEDSFGWRVGSKKRSFSVINKQDVSWTQRMHESGMLHIQSFSTAQNYISITLIPKKE